MSDMELVGEFEVKSGKLVVSDPCYERDSIGGVLENVKNGQWMAFVTYEEFGMGRKGRVSNLIVVHENEQRNVDSEQDIYELDDMDVGVDSGQAGFFDDAVYPTGDRDKNVGCHGKDQFYEECCNQTIGEPDEYFPGAKGTDAGPVPGGVVSQSGYGDGSYTLFLRHDSKGQLVGARIEFLEPEEDEDLEEDDFEEDEAEDEEEAG